MITSPVASGMTKSDEPSGPKPDLVLDCGMSLYQHSLFTIDLNKVIAVSQNEDEAAVTIRTDDQRKIEVATASSEAAVELLNEFANSWETAVGPLLRHEKHVFLTSAIYSIQAEGDEVYIYFRDYSISFAVESPEQALELLAELTHRWQVAIGEVTAT
jgi:hypothetical protein